MPTTARGIWTPSDTDAVDFTTDLATMAGTIDNALGLYGNALRGTASQRAAFLSTAVNGMLWQDTDGIRMIWRKDGANWVPALTRWVGTSAQMSGFTQAVEGFRWWNTSDGKEYLRKSGAWSTEIQTQTQPLTLSKGVAASGYAGPSITLSGGVVTVVGRIDNGNGLTLSSSWQQVAVVPLGFRPSDSVIAPATNASTPAAVVRVTSSGALSVAAPSSISITFAFSYPVA